MLVQILMATNYLKRLYLKNQIFILKKFGSTILKIKKNKCMPRIIIIIKICIIIRDHTLIFFKQLHKEENCKPFIALCNHRSILKIFDVKILKTLDSTTWIIDKPESIEDCEIRKIRADNLPDIKWGGGISYSKIHYYGITAIN